MLINDVVNCLYPNKCAGCDEIIDEGKTLCDYCAVMINNTNYGNFCLKCGLPKEHCRCKYREYHFVRLISVYKNDGIARKVYYSYKLSHREELAPFFAQKTADLVKMLYGDIKFDAVMCVPTVLRSKMKRGFDHVEIITKEVSELLNIPFINGVLKVRDMRTPQHKAIFAERLENVQGKYYTVKRIDKDRVLLFDDISTTGATLDECAKELMFAGVKEVYCVVVLSTDIKKTNNEDK